MSDESVLKAEVKSKDERTARLAVALIAGWEFDHMMKAGGYHTTLFIILSLIVLLLFDAFYPGDNLLLGYLKAALGFRSLENYIGDRGVAAHQDMAAISFFLANPIVVVPNLADLTGENFCQALTAIAVAASISEGEAGVQTGFKES